MLRLILIFVGFIFGTTLGYYLPLNLVEHKASTNLTDINQPSFWEIPGERTNYRKSLIKDGIIESIDLNTGTLILSYYPEPMYKKEIKIMFDKKIYIQKINIKKDGENVISWEIFPKSLLAEFLVPKNVVRVNFEYDDKNKKLVASYINLINI